jgi:hypothetical protein
MNAASNRSDTSEPALPEIQLDFTPDLHEGLEASLYPGAKQRRTVIAICLATAATALLFMVLPIFPDDTEWPWKKIVASLVTGFYCGAAYPTIMMRWSLAKLLKRNPHFLDHVRVTIDSNGFTTESRGRIAKTAWPVISHWVETRSLLLVFLGPDFPSYLPKRAFAGEAELERCRQLLRERVGRTTYSAPLQAFPVTLVVKE